MVQAYPRLAGAPPPSGEHLGEVDDLTLEQLEVAGLSRSQIVRRRFVRHKGAMVSRSCSFSSFCSPYECRKGADARMVEVHNTLVEPKRTKGRRCRCCHLAGWWGRDDRRSPVRSRQRAGQRHVRLTMRGVQVTLVVIFVLPAAVGHDRCVRRFAGRVLGRWTDGVLMRFTDVILVIPLLLVAAVAGYSLGDRGVERRARLGLFLWPGLARLVRAEFLTLRSREFVDAAKIAGASSRGSSSRTSSPTPLASSWSARRC